MCLSVFHFHSTFILFLLIFYGKHLYYFWRSCWKPFRNQLNFLRDVYISNCRNKLCAVVRSNDFAMLLKPINIKQTISSILFVFLPYESRHKIAKKDDDNCWLFEGKCKWVQSITCNNMTLPWFFGLNCSEQILKLF